MAQGQHHRRPTMSRQGKAKRRSPEPIQVSPSEPEAVLGRDKTKVFRPLYTIPPACDLDRAVILGSGVFAAATAAPWFGPLLGRTQDLSGRMPEVVVNDGTEAGILNLKICGDRKITRYAAVPADPPVVPTSPASGSWAGAVASPGDPPGPRRNRSGRSPRRHSLGCPRSRRIAARRSISWCGSGAAPTSGPPGS